MVAAVATLGLGACRTQEPTPFGQPQVTVGSTGASSPGAQPDSSSGSSGLAPEEECTSHEDCPAWSPCNAGRCVSCDEEPSICEGAQVCVRDRCRAIEDLDACEGTGFSQCGNGILQAGEACDGEPGCQSCGGGPANISGWGQPGSATRLVVAADGSVATSVPGDGEYTLSVFDAEGAVQWTRLLSWEPRTFVWSGTQLFVWGEEFLLFAASGELLRRTTQPGVRPLAAASWRGGAVLTGSIDQPNSGVSRGVVRVMTEDAQTLWEATQGDMREATTISVVEDELVLAGPHVDLPRSVVRRLRADGSARWTDASVFDIERDAVVVFPDQEGGNWLFSDDGSAFRFAADGERSEQLPCFGSVRGDLRRVALGPASQIALSFAVYDEPSSSWHSWVVLGQPHVARTAWVEQELVEDLGWTPQGTLLATSGGQIREVSFE